MANTTPTNPAQPAKPAAPAAAAQPPHASEKPADDDAPPRCGEAPSSASMIAPITATTKALARARKKFIAPMATPICWCATAFWIETVTVGYELPVPIPTRPVISATAQTGING